MEKLPIVFLEAPKNYEDIQCFGAQPILHVFNLVRMYTNSITTHNMAQIFHLSHSKRTFGLFHKQVVILKKLQDLSDMFKMNIVRLTIDEGVIKEEKEKSLNIRFHNFIHVALES